jgi:hypothetical protein
MTKENIQGFDKLINSIKTAFYEEKRKKWYEYLFTSIINLILLYIANNILYWNLSFISSSFSEVLFAVNLSLIVRIVGNISFIFYHPPWFKHATKVIINITALLAAYMFYVVFPFIISQNFIVVGLKIIIILAIIATAASTVYEIIRVLYALSKDSEY